MTNHHPALRQFYARKMVTLLVLGLLLNNVASAQTPRSQGQTLASQQTQSTKPPMTDDSFKPTAQAQVIGQDQHQADKPDSYASRNLDAQENMVKWAKRTYFTTLMGLILSAGGLFALLYSLRLNNKATTAAQNAVLVARETNEAQSRAWVSVECQLGKPTRGKTHLGVEGIYFNVESTSKNHGHSPATSVSFHAEIALLGPGSPSMEERMADYCDTIIKHAGHEAEAIFPDAIKLFNHMVFLPNADIEAALEGKDFKMISPVVYGCLNYKSPYTKGIRQTRFVYTLVSFNENAQAIVLMPDKPNWLDLPICLAGPGTIIAK